MLSKNNTLISCKVSKDVYEFIKSFSDKYGVSISVFVQDCITQNILNIDKECRNSENYSTPDVFYKKYSSFLKSSYDERKKKVRF